MNLAERVFLRVFLVLLLSAVVFCFKLIVKLIKKGFGALTGKKTTEKPVIEAKQVPVPPPPPVPAFNAESTIVEDPPVPAFTLADPPL